MDIFFLPVHVPLVLHVGVRMRNVPSVRKYTEFVYHYSCKPRGMYGLHEYVAVCIVAVICE